MGKGTIQYYLTSSGENPVEKFLDSLRKPTKAKIFRIFQYIEFYGLTAPLPHVKKLTGIPLWEIRILGRDNVRILYISQQGNTILLIHGFIKKKQKTPTKEIEVAMNRAQDWIVRIKNA